MSEERKLAKPVSLLELFFDLVFVCAIAKLTAFLENGFDGTVTATVFFQYIFAALIVLQVWLYQTNYNNRFGEGRWYENLVMLINMMAVLFMSNTIGIEWSKISRVFDISMVVMLGSIAVLCFLQSRNGRYGRAEARSYFWMLLRLIAMYGVSAILYGILDTSIPSQVITVIAGIIGAFLPSLVRRGKDFDLSLIDFPHLTERCELLTIVTFGETVAAVSKLFRTDTFDAVSILAFCIIALLFGSYVIHNHYLMDRHRQDTRGAILMLAHYTIVISLNMITVGLVMSYSSGTDGILISRLLAAGSLAYFGGIFLNGIYYGRKVWTRAEVILLAVVITAGSTAMLVIGNSKGCLISMTAVSSVSFLLLFFKNRSKSVVTYSNN
jgi:low temperature requirement protein LtrA